MTVYLVGAGPGSPDLLTLKAARLLATAEIVVHDRLVSPQILEMVSSTATLIDAGKYPGGSTDSQDRINEVLADCAQRADVVVRLKGGDPYVFGRGGEEAHALTSVGVKVEVVPGVTSAIAGPSAAGIPVTMRGISSGFTVVTGHQDPESIDTLDWQALARLNTTLIVLMAASRAGIIAERLLSGGMPSTTAVAAVESATNSNQRVLRTRLGEVADLDVRAPAVLIFGRVAELDVSNANFTSLIEKMAAGVGATT